MSGQPEELFPSVAQALLEAQHRLEHAPPGQCGYSIPRLAARIRFALQIEGRNRVLLLFGRKATEWRQQQMVHYELAAEPHPPVPNRRASRMKWTVDCPSYLLSSDLEHQIAGECASHLAQGNWRYRGERFLDTAEVRREAERVRASMVNLVEGRGMLVFQTGPECYLVIRVADRAERDGVFLYRRGAIPFIEIFSMQNDGEAAMRVEPLLLLLSAVRSASGAGNRQTSEEGGSLPKLDWGWGKLHVLAKTLENSYAEALNLLAAAGSTTTYFHPQGFAAELVYSSWNRKLQAPAPDPFEAADEWIHNRVRLEVSPALTEGRISLLAPEFILNGKARDELLRQTIAAAQDIERAFRSQEPTATGYASAICDRSRQPNAVIALAYDQLPPDQDFVVAWPAGERDFLFSCTSDGRRLRNIEPILGKDTPVRAIRFPDRQFRAIHNFFRAIRLWRTRP